MSLAQAVVKFGIRIFLQEINDI